VITVEDEAMYRLLTATAPADIDTALGGQEIMSRFGIRPLRQTNAMAGSHELEFLQACYLFMQKWAEQFKTTITMTFMPELFPGMRVSLDQHNLVVYVTEVSHVCDYTNGFYTTAVIMAPSSPTSISRQLMLSVNYTVNPLVVDPTGLLGTPGAGRSQAFTNPFGGLGTVPIGGS
jgi:hypothetical protein